MPQFTFEEAQGQGNTFSFEEAKQGRVQKLNPTFGQPGYAEAMHKEAVGPSLVDRALDFLGLTRLQPPQQLLPVQAVNTALQGAEQVAGPVLRPLANVVYDRFGMPRSEPGQSLIPPRTAEDLGALTEAGIRSIANIPDRLHQQRLREMGFDVETGGSPVPQFAARTAGEVVRQGAETLTPGNVAMVGAGEVSPLLNKLILGGFLSQVVPELPEVVGQATSQPTPENIAKALLFTGGAKLMNEGMVRPEPVERGPVPTEPLNRLRAGTSEMPWIFRDRQFNLPDAPQPFQETPPLIGQRPLRVEQKVIQPRPITFVEDQPVERKAPVEPSGGEISFRGEGVPSAMQAKEMVPPFRGRVQMGLDPSELKERLRPYIDTLGGLVGRRGETHGDTLERNGIPSKDIDHPDPRRGFVIVDDQGKPIILPGKTTPFLTRKEAAVILGKGTADAGGADSGDLPKFGEYRAMRSAGMSEAEIEQELSGGTKNAISRPKLLGGPEERAAIQRRNIEPGGKVWQSGEIIDATPEHVVSKSKELQELVDRQQAKVKELQEAKVKNPNASIKEIRSYLLADASETSWEEAIGRYSKMAKSTEQYLKDIQLAGQIYKERTSNAIPELRTDRPTTEQAPGDISGVGEEIRQGAGPSSQIQEAGQGQGVVGFTQKGANIRSLIKTYVGQTGKEKVIGSVEGMHPDDLRQVYQQLEALHKERTKGGVATERGQVALQQEGALWQEIRNRLFRVGLRQGENIANFSAEELQQVKSELESRLQQKQAPQVEMQLRNSLLQVNDLIKKAQPKQAEGGGQSLKFYMGIDLADLWEKVKKFSPIQVKILPSTREFMEDLARRYPEPVTSQEGFNQGLDARPIMEIAERYKALGQNWRVGLALYRYFVDRLKAEKEQRPSEFGDEGEEGIGGKLYGGLPIFDPDLWKGAKELFDKIGTVGMNRQRASALLDAADAKAKLAGREKGNRIKVALPNEVDQNALTFLAEAGGDKAKLNTFASQVRGKNKQAEVAIAKAQTDFDRLQPHAKELANQLEQQRQRENQADVATDFIANYMKHALETEDVGLFDAGPSGQGVSTSFLKPRSYPNYATAIQKGEKPKTLNAAKLLESRVAAGEKLINRQAWVDQLKGLKTTTGEPFATDLVKRGKGKGLEAPEGYVTKELAPGVRAAIHKEYEGLINALTGDSFVKNSTVGSILLGVEGGLKHGLLLFDSYHAFRMMRKELFQIGKISYNKGVSLLEYDKPTVQRLVQSGDLEPKMAKWIEDNRAKKDLLVANGLNVGRIAEALFENKIRKELKVAGVDVNIPGRFNRWVFEKVTRGAMLEAGLREFDRTKKMHLDWTDDRVAAHVAKQENVYFGNLQRQGILKSQSARDVAQIVFLAPQWVESMVQTEARGAKQIMTAPFDSVMKRRLMLGSIGKGVGAGILAYFVANQVINIMSQGQPTWENEDGHKLDAKLPGGYWLSPMNDVAEITHDYIRYGKQGKGPIESTAQIIGNKMSPLGRAAQTAFQGRDYSGVKLSDTGRLKEAAKSLIPTPLPLAGLQSEVPKQTGRQLYSTFGLKVEPDLHPHQDAVEKAGGKKVEQMDLGERFISEFEAAKGKKKLTPEQEAHAAEVSRLNIGKRGTELQNQLDKADRQWLQSRKLSLPGFDNKIKSGGTSVYLTEAETKRMSQLMLENYKAVMPILREQYDDLDEPEEKQALFSEATKAARQLARDQMLEEMSNSKNESNQRKKFQLFK